MIRPALANEGLLRRLNLAISVTGGLIALVASGLGASLLLINGATARAERGQAVATAKAGAAEATLARAKVVKRRTVAPRPDQQIETFGSALAAACREENVTFSSFDNAGDAGLYASRYGGAPEGKDWKASEARVSISGRLADIYTVIARLKGLPIPFEVEAGTLDGVPGDPTVRVSLTIAALVREEKSFAGR